MQTFVCMRERYTMTDCSQHRRLIVFEAESGLLEKYTHDSRMGDSHINPNLGKIPISTPSYYSVGVSHFNCMRKV